MPVQSEPTKDPIAPPSHSVKYAKEDMARSWGNGWATPKTNTLLCFMVQAFLVTNILFLLSIWHFVSDNHHAFMEAFGMATLLKGFPFQLAHDPPFVTFIVPSKGRDTIARSLESLVNQTDHRWEAIVVFDGGVQQEPPKSSTLSYMSDPRIRNYSMPQMGEQNFAALPRNFGMGKASSEWLAFVDDDDVLSCDYVARLWEESRLNPLVETVIFRMSRMRGDGTQVLPPEDHTSFQENYVGISFALKRVLFEHGFWFRPSNIEDFRLLETIYKAAKVMVISPYVTYYVKDARPSDPNVEYPRHYLN